MTDTPDRQPAHARPHAARHRKYRMTLGRRTVRFGMLATAGLAGLATAGTAQAEGLHNDVGVTIDDAMARSSVVHPDDADGSFTVHQLGTVVGASVHNHATARSVACDPRRPCRAIALSFQIDLMSGTNIRLHADNASTAENLHCAGCQTFAGAWQFVVDTAGPFRLDAATQRRLDALHRQLNTLVWSDKSAAEVQTEADALAAQVGDVLKTAVAQAPKTAPRSALWSGPEFRPSVRTFRQVHR